MGLIFLNQPYIAGPVCKTRLDELGDSVAKTNPAIIGSEIAMMTQGMAVSG